MSFIGHLVETLVESTGCATRPVMEPLLRLVSPALVFYMAAIWPGLVSSRDVAKLLVQRHDRTGHAHTAARIVCAFRGRHAS